MRYFILTLFPISNNKWVIIIVLWIILISGSINLLSNVLLRNVNILVAFIILIFIIFIEIIFDIIGVAVASAEEKIDKVLRIVYIIKKDR